ncbi:MAG: lipid-binding SYLF domain-containing protein [Proteobacteria bacterium]|nr:lipid-binding SYLF domain-containing protein [Pseudomonadota bacterium]
MKEKGRNIKFCVLIIVAIFALNFNGFAHAENYSGTIKLFKKSKAVQPFFKSAYGYAVFPVIGKGGFFVGGAYGNGKVYKGGKVTGAASLVKMSVGWQAGGQAFSEIIFFQDKRAYDEFTSGEFALNAQASAVAVTAGAQMQTGSQGASIGASAGPRNGVQAKTKYIKGMAVFVHAKGGLMYEATIGGQKFNFTPVWGK